MIRVRAYGPPAVSMVLVLLEACGNLSQAGTGRENHSNFQFPNASRLEEVVDEG